MMKEYTREQIEKSIVFWKKRLDEIDSEVNLEVQEINGVSEIRYLLPKIVDLVIKTYIPIGGYYGQTNLKKLLITTGLVKVVKNVEGNIVACSFYRVIDGSYKLQAYGNDGTSLGRSGVKEIIKSDVGESSQWVWAEVSGKVEYYFKKFGGYPVPNEYASEVLEKPEATLKLMPDGFHYQRVIGNNSEATEKVIFGFKSQEIADKVLKNVDYELRRSEFNEKLITRGLEEADGKRTELECASSFVNQLSDLYDEEDLNQLPPGLSSEFDESIEVLQKHINDASWVSQTLELAKVLRDEIGTVKFFKIGEVL